MVAIRRRTPAPGAASNKTPANTSRAAGDVCLYWPLTTPASLHPSASAWQCPATSTRWCTTPPRAAHWQANASAKKAPDQLRGIRPPHGDAVAAVRLLRPARLASRFNTTLRTCPALSRNVLCYRGWFLQAFVVGNHERRIDAAVDNQIQQFVGPSPHMGLAHAPGQPPCSSRLQRNLVAAGHARHRQASRPGGNT